MDFSPQYETEALLRGGDERQARAEVQRLGERLGSNRRFRIPYLRSLAVLAAWDGHSEQAISYLHEAARLAADIGLPGERWQTRRRWERCIRQEESRHKRAARLVRRQRSSRGWRRASETRRCACAFLRHHRFKILLVNSATSILLSYNINVSKLKNSMCQHFHP